jgi:hypothetical protein
MSLNMLIDYTGADCRGWLKDAILRRTWVEHLAGPDSMWSASSSRFRGA